MSKGFVTQIFGHPTAHHETQQRKAPRMLKPLVVVFCGPQKVVENRGRETHGNGSWKRVFPQAVCSPFDCLFKPLERLVWDAAVQKQKRERQERSWCETEGASGKLVPRWNSVLCEVVVVGGDRVFWGRFFFHGVLALIF